MLASLAASDKAVLLEGEAGTGKELVAEELHLASRRKDAPFVTLDASALPTQELDARLFGAAGETGLVDQAKGGTLFVNEIGNVPRDMQAKLRELIAASGDLRFIAGTRRDLDRDVASGRFADDLFFLLAGGRIELPPLRERDGDVALLAGHFWSELAESEAESRDSTLPEDFLPRFEHYPWPGNVRELNAAVVARKTLGELGQAHRSAEAKDNGLDFLLAVAEDDLHPLSDEDAARLDRIRARVSSRAGDPTAARKRFQRLASDVVRELHDRTTGGKAIGRTSGSVPAAAVTGEWKTLLAAAKGGRTTYSATARVTAGDVVEHPKFGPGVVLGVEPGRAHILFESGARKLVAG